jgi:hypothetical protein
MFNPLRSLQYCSQAGSRNVHVWARLAPRPADARRSFLESHVGRLLEHCLLSPDCWAAAVIRQERLSRCCALFGGGRGSEQQQQQQQRQQGFLITPELISGEAHMAALSEVLAALSTEGVRSGVEESA